MSNEMYVHTAKAGLLLGKYFDAKREIAEENGENAAEITNSYHELVLEKLREAQVHSYYPKTPQAMAHAVPWLTDRACEYLRSLVVPSAFVENDDEPEDARIPEVVLLDRYPEVGEALCNDFYEYIEPLVQALYGYELSQVNSVQLALYEADGRVPSGCLHTDEDSDLTVTVALNDDYEGGGLHILTGGSATEVLEVPKQPAGTATIFEGRTKVHMGQPVTRGKRYLLVFWCSI